MIRRLEDTWQVFSLSSEQENYLRDRGVSYEVVRAMRDMNQGNDRSVSRDRDLGSSSASDRYDRPSDRYEPR
jgi:hypothetical protein